MDFTKDIKDYLELEIQVLKNIDMDAVNDALNLIHQTYLKDATIYIFGNGGSASTASHFQNDFNKGISEYVDKKFNFLCLNDNISTVMAIANDIGYGDIFSFQLTNKLKNDDIVMAISGSGNPQNIIKAVEYAKSNGNKVIGLTGFDGGKLATICDVSLNVNINSSKSPRICI